jgi:hypothetical protein
MIERYEKIFESSGAIEYESFISRLENALTNNEVNVNVTTPQGMIQNPDFNITSNQNLILYFRGKEIAKINKNLIKIRYISKNLSEVYNIYDRNSDKIIHTITIF